MSSKFHFGELVNYKGDPLDLASTSFTPKKPTAKLAESSHGGWRVFGIPPGALDKAMQNNKVVSDMAKASCGAAIKPFDTEQWRMNYRKSAVHSRSYGIPEAAETCRALAEKEGWSNLEIRELKKEVQQLAANKS